MTLVVLCGRKEKRPDGKLLQRVQDANPYSLMEHVRTIEPKDPAFMMMLAKVYVERIMLRVRLPELALKADLAMPSDPALWIQVIQASSTDNPYSPVAPGFFVSQSAGNIKTVRFDLGQSRFTQELWENLLHRRYSMMVFQEKAL